ncbi:MAG: thioredoxin domain-containing protein [Deltaproteobacteria bacterium]|nr:thioredoxin domain-containing protein [Deltaproteobacteria bacterium]
MPALVWHQLRPRVRCRLARWRAKEKMNSAREANRKDHSMMFSRQQTTLALAACLALAGLVSAVRAADSDVLATVDGKPITEGDVRKLVQGKLISIESEMYDAKKEGVDALIMQRLLEKEAKAKGVSVDALLETEIAAKVSEPTSAEVESLYEQAKDRIEKPIEEVREALVQHLRNARIEAMRETYVGRLRSQAKVSIKIKPPVVNVPGTGPTRGPANAPITIIEFSDFQCPYCSRAEQAVEQVLSTYKDKVRLVFRDYPLGFHPFAQKAAEAARCAGDQGKYWEYHGTLFKNQQALQQSDLEKYAADLKLDSEKFKTCLTSDKYAEAVQKDVEVGNSVGVNGTPAFFINGRFISGAVPFENFQEIIDDILKEKGAAS